MNLRTYQMNSKQLFKMATEKGLYAQVVMILRNKSDDKKEEEKPRNITSKDNKQDQDVGLVLIMSIQKKFSGHMKQIYIETVSK